MTERPRDFIYDYVTDRLASLSARSLIECQEPTCGAKNEEGEIISCLSVNCGEKRMMSGWKRELKAMRYVKALVEGLERAELQREAAADKRGKR